MNIIKYPSQAQWQDIVTRPLLDTTHLNATVKRVLNDIRTHGDAALIRYDEKLDHAVLSTLQVTEAEIEQAEQQVDDELKRALQLAHENIYRFHAAQRFDEIHVVTAPGVECWQKSVAIEKVGLYIPGGSAPLYSSVLMLATPAKLAGCIEIVLCTPTDRS